MDLEAVEPRITPQPAEVATPPRDAAWSRPEPRGATGAGILWVLASTAEVPAHDAWLGPRERAHLAGLRVAKRRIDWRLGRWCAKRALRAFAGITAPLADLEILADPDGAPRAWLGDRPLPLAVSLSHRDGRAACVVAPDGTRLGCDLETVEPRSDAFLRDYFTAREADRALRLAAGPRPLHAALVWSAKESALKALRTGLRRDTRSVEVTHLDEDDADLPGWHPLAVRDVETGTPFPGWWRALDGQVLTVVTDSGDAAPPFAPAERPGAAARRGNV